MELEHPLMQTVIMFGIENALDNAKSWVEENRNKANSMFKRASIRLDMWSNENNGYGVLFSKWDDKKNDYIVLDSRGIE